MRHPHAGTARRAPRRGRLSRLAALFAVLLVCAPATRAYDNDTHFWLTYYLAVKSGYTPTQATQIASAAISVDFDGNTQPLTPRALSLSDVRDFMQNVRAHLHALPKRNEVDRDCRGRRRFNWRFDWRRECEVESDAAVQSCVDDKVRRGQDELWRRVSRERDNPGVFFHYMQDKYAHRGFRSFWGHACYMRADFLDSDRAKASAMARETVEHLRNFMSLRWPDRPLPPAPDWQEIDATLVRLFDANPSRGVEPSPLLRLLQASGVSRLEEFFRLNARETYAAFNTRPNSSKARAVVVAALGLPPDTRDPEIWLYDLKKNGEPDDEETNRIAAYCIPTNDALYDETENLARREGPREDGKRLCLPWALVEPGVTRVLPCR